MKVVSILLEKTPVCLSVVSWSVRWIVDFGGRWWCEDGHRQGQGWWWWILGNRQQQHGFCYVSVCVCVLCCLSFFLLFVSHLISSPSKGLSLSLLYYPISLGFIQLPFTPWLLLLYPFHISQLFSLKIPSSLTMVKKFLPSSQEKYNWPLYLYTSKLV